MSEKRNISNNVFVLLSSGYEHYSRKWEREYYSKILLEEEDLDFSKFKDLLSGYQLNLRMIKNYLICLVAITCRYAADFGADDLECYALSDTYIELIENKLNLTNWISYSEEIISSYRKLVKLGRLKRYSYVVNRAITIAEQSAYKKVSVKSIAGELNVHPNYLSSKFHKETGESLNNHIAKIKAEKGKRLIENTSYSLSEIAEILAFSSESHFARAFRKIYYVSPGELKSSRKI